MTQHAGEEPRSTYLVRVDEALRARAEPERLAPAAALLQLWTDDLAIASVATMAAEDLAGAVLSLIELASIRTPGETSIRVFNPSPEHNGWGAEHTVIEIVNDDMPFLVDSVMAALNRLDLHVHHVVHPQVIVTRDGDGRLRALEAPDRSGTRRADESMMHIEIEQLTAAASLRKVQTQLETVLADVRAAVEDWPQMSARVAAIERGLRARPPEGIVEGELEEALRFLAWINADHFTFLGARDYALVERDGKRFLRPEIESGLGHMRELDGPSRAAAKRPLAQTPRAFLDGPRPLAISKSSRRSTVHRPVHLDLITVKRFDDAGRLIGERRISGLFTSRAYTINVGAIPLVRKKVDEVVHRAAFLPASHNAKALRALIEHYSRDELFQTSVDDLFAFSMRILQLQLHPQPALLVRHDDAGRFASCMVYVPRDHHSTGLRLRMQALIEKAFGGQVTDYYTWITDRPLAQIHLIVRRAGRPLKSVDVSSLERSLAVCARSWSDELKATMTECFGEETGLSEWRMFRDAFPLAYQERTPMDAALEDIAVIEDVLRTRRLRLRLYRNPDQEVGCFFIKTFELETPAALSVFLPMLENMGLEVLRDTPYVVEPDGAVHPVWLRAFEVRAPFPIDLEMVGDRFREAFQQVWRREVEDDGFNRLVLGAGLSWREVVVLRAYGHYLRQTGSAYSKGFMSGTLIRHAAITKGLIELFMARLDPARQDDEATVSRLRDGVRQQLEVVKRVDEDRVLRSYLTLVRKTVRTNFFQSTSGGNPKPYVSLKLDTESISFLPLPRPRFEVFVYSPRFEAVHLRGGAVARGGIRWSDRRADFRTEILGLVKAQMVKNAVIVPVGAKGGFVLKRPPRGREARQAEAVACYQDMIRGLLDLTDNYQGETVVPPPGVVRRDGDDPYLVVAADKGTATFSDIANGVAAEYDFWLGDAFASGGSAGYDHKKMGITARGAWESVVQHLRELGLDAASAPITAVGVGDMSGDVFGNGMLRSKHLRLLGAFNHLHVFVDPDPDPARAFAERQRLFALPRSSWDGYDPEALSEGGAVFDRQEKSITVSEVVRTCFGLPSRETTPDALVRAILTAQVDLLWFGGIGTYVKASSERHGMVGDRANDELRVDAPALRCKVIGEGANLGLTQAARVEYALGGGRCYTDFIDNSGGVNCSDHEVNIKIALADAVASETLMPSERDQLLEAMTDEVAALVLRGNAMQARAISQASARSGQSADEHAQLMSQLERQGVLDRAFEGLPDDAALAERRDGLTRPELAVLLSYSKIHLYDRLLASDLPDAPELATDLVRSFPSAMQVAHRAQIEGHRLRREIVATQVANSLVNRLGPTFVSRQVAATGRTARDVAAAYLAAREVFDLRALWAEIEALAGRVEATVQVDLSGKVQQLLERVVRWFLRHEPTPIDVARAIETYQRDTLLVVAQIEDILPGRSRKLLRDQAKRLAKRGVPGTLARQIAGLPVWPAACDLVRVARTADVGVERVGLVYFRAGERFYFDRLRRSARRLKPTDRWQRAARGAAVEELYGQQAALTLQVVSSTGEETHPRAAIASWIDARPSAVAHFDELMGDLEGVSKLDVVGLTVAAREVRRLVAD